jgi:hypothetical protein
VMEWKYEVWLPEVWPAFPLPFYVSMFVFVIIAWVLIRTPLRNAGSPDEPAPPSAMM